jgi:opacity protein-like surface antigen
MNDGVRSGKMAFHGVMLLVSCSLIPLGWPVAASAQPVPPQPVPGQQSPTVTPTEAERAREAERLRQAERARAAEPETRIEQKVVRPSETYLAGFGGYTFGGKIDDVEGTGFLSGLNLNDRDLADAGVYGGKLGHFFGDRMDWLGVEMEAFNTTPHIEQRGPVPGSHLRVTTLAFNLIGRLKFGCETKTVRTETRTDREIRYAQTERERRYETRYEREFCRLQPYGGVGLGVFFANLSTNGNSVSDNGVPGLNALAGVRYYFTERIALFGEYKYNYAVFDASTSGPFGGAGFKGDYQANHVVGGLSFHF